MSDVQGADTIPFDIGVSDDARSPSRAYICIALAIAVLVHAAVIVVLLATGSLEERRAPRPDRVIDIVSLQDFQATPPPLVEAPASVPLPPTTAPSPSVAAVPSSAPSATSAEDSADQTLLHENLAPAKPGSAGMAVATGVPQGVAASKKGSNDGDGEYIPQFQVTELPVIPIKNVLARIEYPALAAKQGLEATVYLELYIDRNGRIVKATVLKDSGYGFAEAAIKALVGVVCAPAKIGDEPAAVRYRFPVRFTLK